MLNTPKIAALSSLTTYLITSQFVKKFVALISAWSHRANISRRLDSTRHAATSRFQSGCEVAFELMGEAGEGIKRDGSGLKDNDSGATTRANGGRSHDGNGSHGGPGRTR